MKKIIKLYKDLMAGEKPDFALWTFPIIGLLILCLLPFLLTRKDISFLDYTTTGQIGDTIGGIAGPVIALIASLLTFLAFWIQVKANKAQTTQFDKQDTDTKIDRFENKFYELLKLHRENVAEINIANTVHNRKAFVSMFKEFKFGYHCLKLVYGSQQELHTITRTLTEQDFVNISFIIFFMGIGENSDKLTQGLIQQYEEVLIVNYLEYLKVCQSRYSQNGQIAVDIEDNQIFTLDIKYKPFCGHMSRLGHYYRHLFQTVKFVVEQDSEVIKDKYEYLKTLRAQLSSHEQLLLYYNGLTTMGKPWIENNFFTDYRMIKNLPLPLADFGLKPKEKLGERNKDGKLLFEWDEITQLN
jgi:hypothetical protein